MTQRSRHLIFILLVALLGLGLPACAKEGPKKKGKAKSGQSCGKLKNERDKLFSKVKTSEKRIDQLKAKLKQARAKIAELEGKGGASGKAESEGKGGASGKAEGKGGASGKGGAGSK